MSDSEDEPQNDLVPMTDAECEVAGNYRHIPENVHTSRTRNAHRRHLRDVRQLELTEEGDGPPCGCVADEDGRKCYDGRCPNVLDNVACSDRCGGQCCNNFWNPDSAMPFVGSQTTCIRRVSERVGNGVFAARLIRAGQPIGEYVGVVQFLEEVRGPTNYNFSIAPVNQVVNPLHMGNRMRCINHSCDPNLTNELYVHHGLYTIVFRAIRDIRPGEQLGYNYNWTFSRPEDIPDCGCNAPTCTGKVGIYRPPRGAKAIGQTRGQTAKNATDERSEDPAESSQGHHSKSIKKSSSGGTRKAPTSSPRTFPSALKNIARGARAALETSINIPPRLSDFIETHEFGPLDEAYVIISMNGVLGYYQGRVHECFQNDAHVTIYAIRVGRRDYYVPRWLVYHYAEDARYRLQHLFSDQDSQNAIAFTATPPSSSRAADLTNQLTEDYARMFNEGRVPATRIIPTLVAGATAAGLPTHEAVPLSFEGPPPSDVMSVGSEEAKQACSAPAKLPQKRPQRQTARKRPWQARKLADNSPHTERAAANLEDDGDDEDDVQDDDEEELVEEQERDEYDPGFRRPFEEVVNEVTNQVYLNRLLSTAADNVAILAHSRIQPEQGIDFNDTRTLIFNDLRRQYFELEPHLRQFLNINHYRLARDIYSPGAFTLWWCSLCGRRRTFADTMQESRHFNEHHSVVAPVYRCPKKGCKELYNHPSRFRKHVTECDPNFALGLRNDLPDYIMDAYADFIAMTDAGNRQLYAVPPGIPLFKDIEGVPSHRRGAPSQSRKAIRMDRTKMIPEGSTKQPAPVKLTMQKSFKNLADWPTFRYSTNRSAAPRLIEDRDDNGRETEQQQQSHPRQTGGLVDDGQVAGPSGTQSNRPRSKSQKRRRDSKDSEEVAEECVRRTRSKTNNKAATSSSAKGAKGKKAGKKDKAPRMPESDNDDDQENSSD